MCLNLSLCVPQTKTDISLFKPPLHTSSIPWRSNPWKSRAVGIRTAMHEGIQPAHFWTEHTALINAQPDSPAVLRSHRSWWPVSTWTPGCVPGPLLNPARAEINPQILCGLYQKFPDPLELNEAGYIIQTLQGWHECIPMNCISYYNHTGQQTGQPLFNHHQPPVGWGSRVSTQVRPLRDAQHGHNGEKSTEKEATNKRGGRGRHETRASPTLTFT